MTQSMRQYVTLRFEDLRAERSSWVSHWKELSQNIEPRIGRYLTSDNDKGSKKNGNIINSTATQALRTLTSGLMTGLTSPARPWFKLGLSNAELNNVKSNRLWLDQVEEILLTIFRKSNVYQSFISVYEELGLAGTGCLFVESDVKTVINTKVFTVGEYYYSIGTNGHVNTFCREFQKTVKQLVEEFGYENCSSQTQNQWDNERYENWVEVRHLIENNTNRKRNSFLAKHKPFISYYWEVGGNQNGESEGFLRISGFDEFPIMPPRWDVKSSDVYGRSPGMDVLGDVKQLQTMEKKKAKAIAKLIDPPMNGAPGIQPSQTNTAPGGFTSVKNIGGQKSFEPSYELNPRLFEFLNDIEKVEARIKRGLYEDLFLAISHLDDVRTATEIIERKEEKLLMLGPVIERIQVELLDPLIERTFAIANRMGLIPEPPEELEANEIEIDYISPLAQAQKAVATGNIERLGAYVGNAAQLNPNALDKFDFDESIDQYAKALGAPAKLIKDKKVVEEDRAARAQQMQAQQMAEQTPGVVDSAKKLSEIDPAGNDIINNILGNANG